MHEQQQAAALQHQQEAMEPKAMEQQHILDPFPLFGDEQPSSVLQLSTLPPQFHPYRLQPTQPNLQDSTLQRRSFGMFM